ncbi:MAG: aquaporin [Candidatus Zixiibacteriota bacterium]
MNQYSEPTPVQKYVAELIGTFFLVFIGVMAIMNDANGSGIGLVGIALAHGLALAGAVAAVGGISGAHVNPAVSIALAATGKMNWSDVPGYIVAQLVGSLLAVLIARGLLGDVASLGACLPGTGVSEGVALATEIALTFLLVFVICSVATDPDSAGRAIVPLANGFTVSFDILAGGPISGAAMNPARWFGPAVVGSNYTAAWVYLVGPIVGGGTGAFAYQFVRANK